MIGRITAGLVVLVAGCGLPAATPATTQQSPRMRIEYARADCMRERGFHYEPFIPPMQRPSAEQQKEFDGDYAAMRASRARIGYRVFSGLVYRSDPTAGGMDATIDDTTNGAIAQRLNPAQTDVYRAADEGCFQQAVQEVLHRRVTDVGDLSGQMRKVKDREKSRLLDHDPRLVALARTYAACMREKGYKIPSDAPTRVSWAEPDRFRVLASSLAGVGPPKNGEPPDLYIPDLTPEQAEPYLRKEIASALDDLECGKEFFPVYLPREQAVADPIVRAWGLDW